MIIAKQNYFGTLNEALDSEGLVSYWKLGVNIAYGETASCIKDGKYISVYRDERGMYERPIHYLTKREDS
ncbi:MAG: hypothetical protein KJO69_04725 [Gammaproteobacteria bacterium]|nr:hypothetical protein [Gammaproteobacteria bacterium]